MLCKTFLSRFLCIILLSLTAANQNSLCNSLTSIEVVDPQELETRLIFTEIDHLINLINKAIQSKITIKKIVALVEKEIKKRKPLSLEHEKRLAYHESGHALVQAYMGFPITHIHLKKHKHGLGSILNKKDPTCFDACTKKKLLGIIMTMQAGCAAEKVIFGDFSPDIVGDLKKAAELATLMVTEWGMSSKHEGVPSLTLEKESENKAHISKILQEQWVETCTLLQKEKSALKKIAKKLLKNKKLSEKEIITEITGFNLKDKPSASIEVFDPAKEEFRFIFSEIDHLLDAIGKTAVLSKITIKKIVALVEKEIKKRKPLSLEHEKRLAYHESGHALVQAYMGFPITHIHLKKHKHGLGSILNEKDPTCFDAFTKKKLLEIIMAIQAGCAAEKVIFGDFSPDIAGDLKKAVELATLMVTEWGMSSKHEGVPSLTLEKESENKAHISTEDAQEITKILQEQWTKTCKLLQKEKKSLERIANKLLECNKLSGKEIVTEITGFNLTKEISTNQATA